MVGAAGPDRELIRTVLTSLGHDVSMGDAVVAKRATLPRADVVLIDLAAGQDALRFLRWYAAQPDHAPIVAIVDRRRPAASADALRLGAVDIVARPVLPAAIASALANAREVATIARDSAPVPDPVADPVTDGVFGASAAMRGVLASARRAGAAHCNVLIVGERGTGREMVARIVHGSGAHPWAPFVKIVCAGVSARQFHDVIAATEAHATVYLENLGDLLPKQQIELDQALGRTALRFIAAAQPRISWLVDTGAFRRDLLDALATIRIDVPTLRQRAEDIPLLAMHFLKTACLGNGAKPKTFSRAALALVSTLPWAGNALELRGLCERLAILVPRGVVLVEDVLPHVSFDGDQDPGMRRYDSLKLARERFERDYITSVLKHHKGRMGAAAKALGIERTNLYRKIKQLNIRWVNPPADERE